MEKAYELRDYLTFKSYQELKYKKYKYGGHNQEGNRCIITKYNNFNEEYKCYEIEVMLLDSRNNSVWRMLEYEFKEYDLFKARNIIYES